MWVSSVVLVKFVIRAVIGYNGERKLGSDPKNS